MRALIFLSVAAVTAGIHVAGPRRRSGRPFEALLAAAGRTLGPRRLGRCPVCGEPEKVGVLPEELLEASALATSTLHSGLYYTINDDPDGDQAVPPLYAIRETGQVVATFNLTGFDPMNKLVWAPKGHVDLEAIQTGWCIQGGSLQAGSCIIVGNVGQNCARVECEFVRKSGLYALWQFREPESLPIAPAASEEQESSPTPGAGELVGEQFWFRFPEDGKGRDVETLIADSGELLVVTKENHGPSGVYRLPAFASDNSVKSPAVLERQGEIPALSKFMWWQNLIVDGTVTNTTGMRGTVPNTTGVLLLGYTDVLYYPREPNETLEQALKGLPCHLPHPTMRQSEGITWAVDGAGVPFYLMTGEGEAASIQKVQCPFDGTPAASSLAWRSALRCHRAALAALALLVTLSHC